jgi:hypothetical protein
MLMWGRGFRPCGRPPLPLDFVSLDIAAILPVVATVVAGMCSSRRWSALTLDLRWGLLDSAIISQRHQTVPPHSPDGEYVPRSIEVKNAGDFSAVFFVLQGIGEYDFFRAPEGLTQDEIERIVM